MRELFIALLIFFCLAGAALGTLAVYERFPPSYRQEDTHNVVKLAAGIFALMTSLVLGLLVNAAKNRFEASDRGVHALATEIVLLDRTMRLYGPETAPARHGLTAYVRRALDMTWPADGEPVVADPAAERLLDEVETSLKTIAAPDAARADAWREIKQHLHRVVELRWGLVGDADRTIPVPLLIMMVAWLTLIFASFGYRAPKNVFVAGTLVLSALVISSSLYVIMDMDSPFAGPMQISAAPLERALEQLRR